jgi:phage shock protein A
MSVWTTLFALPGEFWALARKVQDLFELQDKTRETLDDLAKKIEQLERRMTYLEASQSQVITEAKAAAAAASTVLAGGILSDTVTRLTRLEIKLENMPADRPTLPPP